MCGVMNIPYLSQNNYPNYVFPVHSGSSMSGTGCGIVSTTMVLRYLTDKDIKVQDVATWADNNGYFNGRGSKSTIFKAAAQNWKVGNVKVVSKDINAIKNALMNGRPVISLQKSGIFTNNQQCIVLTGIDNNEKIHVNNPNGPNQDKTYSTSEINSKAGNYYIFDAKK